MEFNCRERCGAVDIAEVSCIRGFLALPQQSPAPVFDGSLFIECNFTTACNGQTLPRAHHCSMGCVCAGLFLCHVTARISFPTTTNVSYFLNPLILACTRPQLRVEMEFELVISADLLCLQLGWFLYSQSVPHLWLLVQCWEEGWFLLQTVTKILPITEIFIAKCANLQNVPVPLVVVLYKMWKRVWCILN